MTQSRRSEPLTRMTAKELADTTAEFDVESAIDSFGKPTAAQKTKVRKAERKRKPKK